MKLHTTSEVISLARKLEMESASFYEELAKRHDKDSQVLQSFARENRTNITQVEQAYYSVISDAIEGCFAFDLEADSYICQTVLTDNISYADALKSAVKIEETILEFYLDAAEQSKLLMADVPRAFIQVANKRKKRAAELKSLLGANWA